MIANATPEMMSEMTVLWKKCFGDSEEYIRFFFEQNLKGKNYFENQYVYLQDGKAVSMLTVLEGRLAGNCEERTFWYVYAVATDEDYRRRGYAGALVKYILDKASAKNILVGLVPANEPLYQYYQKFGFETAFFQKVTYTDMEFVSQLDYKLIEMDELKYKELRDKAFSKQVYIEWNEKAVRYAIEENRKLGGMTCYIEDSDYFLMVCPGEDILIVRETNCPITMLVQICSCVGQKWNCKKVKIIASTIDNSFEANVEKHGMIFGSQLGKRKWAEKNAYLGLALD